SNQVLTEIDQNVLALIGSTVVEGHETVQESNVQFEWLDNSNVCNVNNDGDGERFSIICTNQEITQEPIPQNSLFPQNNYSSIPEKNDASEISLNNDNCTNNIKQSSTNMKTIEVETPTTATINTSHISITPTLNSVSIKKGIKRTTAQRYDKSIEQTEKLTTISQKDYE
ncbi:formin-J-like, partial [Mycetomoellerius zeteki]|uniref:formin-J-like n=1 Tax=Mycetomoellerius zeteki TaxID=64791 RepID=UPI00084E82D1